METIVEAIRAHPAEAAEALAAIQIGLDDEKPLTAASLLATAESYDEDGAEFWLERLQLRGLVKAFVNALSAHGINIDGDELADPTGSIPFDKLTAFLPRANAFRCRILKNGAVAGSGVLVGPSLVLTAWHVISVKAPNEDQVPTPTLKVLLSDQTVQVVYIQAAFQSLCGVKEYAKTAPVNDAEVADCHDVALLAMARPAAAHLGYASLPSPVRSPRSNNRLVLIHFPDGQDKGVDFGYSKKIRSMRARWRHDVTTSDVSSGGACFDRDLQFIGVHQGKFDTGARRFVPLDQFGESVTTLIKADLAPTSLWSLDGTAAGQLVVGRNLFFEGLAKAGNTTNRVRGVRLKRRRLDDGSTGLSFSHDILQQLLTRRGPNHRLVRVSLDEMVPDLVADIRRRISQKGLTVPESAVEPGVAPGQAPPETTAKDRAAILAASVEDIAAEMGLTVWFYFDNPTVALSEPTRLVIEGFIDAALTKPHLRLVIAGFETMPLPGLEFSGPTPSESERAPGLVVEFIGGFRKADIVDVLTRASQELTGVVDLAVVEHDADLALIGLDSFNGVYADELLAVVTERLRPALALLEQARVLAEDDNERATEGEDDHDDDNGGGG